MVVNVSGRAGGMVEVLARIPQWQLPSASNLVAMSKRCGAL
jgi:hypothetical protein